MEMRSKSGLLRGREFAMKDLYSFHTDENNRDEYYQKMAIAYKKIFNRVGIGDKTYFTLAGGGTFSKYSHEFQTLTSAGEDIIHICEKCHIAINNEIIDEQKVCPECGNKNLEKEKAVEVGNIFKLKNKFAEDFDLKFKNKNSNDELVVMGCYGIGLGRLMGIIVEIFHDEKGIIWPENVAPFKIHLLNLAVNNKQLTAFADKIYNNLQKANVEVLYDNRKETTIGEKFNDADLIGIPYRAVISEKNGNKIEIKKEVLKK